MDRESTCWTLVQGAARGVAEDVDMFVRLYGPVVSAYVSTRWPSSPLRDNLEDAVQEVFVECFKEGGVLDRAGPENLGSFRAFLLGVARNVSLRFESRMGRDKDVLPAGGFNPDQMAADEERLSLAFDRAWARSLLREAVSRQAERAVIYGPEAEKRVELLRLRFQEGKKLRGIAEEWHVEHPWLKRQNAQALQEFEEALKEVIAFHYPDAPAEAEREMATILAALR
jgi:RNA polymerase sigma-70 factor (ECF subfamily)